MKKIFVFVLLFTFLVANDELWFDTTKIFLGFGINKGEMKIKKDLHETMSINPQEEETNGYTLQTGYVFSQRVKFMYNMKQLSLDDGDFTFNYFSIDYQLTTREPFYMGLDLGTGEYRWKKSPYDAASVNDTKLSSSLFGIHLGYPYKIMDTLEFYGQLNYLQADFKTKIINPNVEGIVIHEELIDIMFGLKYRFK